MSIGILNAENPCSHLHYWLPKLSPLSSRQETGRIFCEESEHPKKKNLKAKRNCTLVGKIVSYRGTG